MANAEAPSLEKETSLDNPTEYIETTLNSLDDCLSAMAEAALGGENYPPLEPTTDSHIINFANTWGYPETLARTTCRQLKEHYKNGQSRLNRGVITESDYTQMYGPLVVMKDPYDPEAIEEHGVFETRSLAYAIEWMAMNDKRVNHSGIEGLGKTAMCMLFNFEEQHLRAIFAKNGESIRLAGEA